MLIINFMPPKDCFTQIKTTVLFLIMATRSVLIILAAGESISFYEFYQSRHFISWFDQVGKKLNSEPTEEFFEKSVAEFDQFPWFLWEQRKMLRFEVLSKMVKVRRGGHGNLLIQDASWTPWIWSF